ncbi:MAG: translation initiation factor IF-2 [Flavobacteriaceae bacterium]|nr:translation initiation factor IF-2 [Flavobacteriaceae bacterium]
MAVMVKKYRISKVLRELNISLQTASNFFDESSISIEKLTPNSKIDHHVYEMLLKQFADDKKRKAKIEEIYREKIKEREEILGVVDQPESSQNFKEEIETQIQKPFSEVKSRESETPKKDTTIKKPTAEKPLGREAIRSPQIIGFRDLEPKKSKPKEVVASKPSESKVKEPEPKTDQIDSLKPKEPEKTHTGFKKTGKEIDLEKIKEKERGVKESREKKSAEQKASKPRRRRRRISSGRPAVGQPQNSKHPKSKSKPKIFEPEVSDEDISKKVKETLEKLTASRKGLGAKHRAQKRAEEKKAQSERAEKEKDDRRIVNVTEFVTVSQLASILNTSPNDVIAKAMSNGIMATMNQRLTPEELEFIGLEYDVELVFEKSERELSLEEKSDDDTELVPRPPVVAVMGHVDHGKTSLLDYICKSNMVAGESGGITQHIGAYGVELPNQKRITFIDTPGHQAFTAMRARGAQVTDMAIIVIAADDDIKPQTVEAINHAQAADVPIIFAINKIDKQTANPEQVKISLSQRNLLVEDLGGQYQCQEISAIKGTGIDDLLEKILLQAELSELRANPNRLAEGVVLESNLDKGRGFVTTVLVKNGTLKVGDYVLVGSLSGKIRALMNERGKRLQSASPSTAVSVLGLDGAPQTGSNLVVLEDEREAKLIASGRKQLDREQILKTQKHLTLDEIGRRLKIENFQTVNIVLKGDVDGSVEALADSIEQLSNDEIELKIIHKGVGAITESDINLASASEAIVIGFNVRPTGNVRLLAEKEKIDVRTYSIIYDAIDDIKDAIEGMLSPELKEEVTGMAEIRETYKISRLGTIAGCMVTSGKIVKNGHIRLLRDGVVKFSGEIASLKRFRDDVKEVSKGYDCGIQIKNYNDLLVGDQLEGYFKKKVRKKISSPTYLS